MQEFIEQNRKFWSGVQIRQGGKKLLIDEPRHPLITHGNAFYALVLNQARGFLPVWLNDGKGQSLEFMQSYVPEAQMAKSMNYSWGKKVFALLLAVKPFLAVNISGKLLRKRGQQKQGLHYDGVYYGDIVYDIYLGLYETATIKRVRGNVRLLKMIALIILRHGEIRKILQSDDYAGVLVSHQVGIEAGAMLRVALRYGYLGFLSADLVGLQCYRSPDEVYDYQFKPTPADIDRIISRLGDKVNNVYREILDSKTSKKGDWDLQNAFSAGHLSFGSREAFNSHFKLNPAKKNIFVMVHVFNDHPHAHFRWMIFNDYYDWLVQTLEFAKKDPNVNWVFKQHPSAKFYKVDVNVQDLFKNCPNNIIYIDENNQIDTGSLAHCADAVITCLGSAGFELPALAAKPSVIAADTFYNGLGFAKEPETKSQYLEVLAHLDKIQLLPLNLQLRARAAFCHIYEFSRIPLSIYVRVTFDEQRGTKLHDWYWNKILERYTEKRQEIYKEFSDCVAIVKQPNFKRFNSFEAYCKEHNL